MVQHIEMVLLVLCKPANLLKLSSTHLMTKRITWPSNRFPRWALLHRKLWLLNPNSIIIKRVEEGVLVRRWESYAWVLALVVPSYHVQKILLIHRRLHRSHQVLENLEIQSVILISINRHLMRTHQNNFRAQLIRHS